MSGAGSVRILLSFLLGTLCAQAQFAVGVRGGVPLTDFLSIASNPTVTTPPKPTRFLIGPTVELPLPIGFAVELDALYRRLDYTARQNLVDEVVTARSGSGWEFPLLVKYKVPGFVVRPFLDAGMSFNHWSAQKETAFAVPVTFLGANASTSVSNAGLVLGGGFEIHLPLIRISPELRFTHWSAKDLSNVSNLLVFKQNQAEFLVGITF